MDINHRLALSYYKTLAVINGEHNIILVQHQESRKIYIQKILDVYNPEVYQYLSAHPIKGTPRIIECFEEGHQLILIEEYISGVPLSEKIAGENMTLQEIHQIINDLCDVLYNLHTLNTPIVHRDIKPSNIIITHYGRAVLLDFNAARFCKKDSTSDTILLGTKGYAAPEQYGFAPSSPKTDIYALGVLLREMLNNLPEDSKDLHQVADKCTQMNPADRYQTVNQLKEALSAVDKRNCSSESGLNSDSNNTSSKDQAASHSIRRFLPPGWRSFTYWKMILSSCYYVFMTWICLTATFKNVSGYNLLLYRIFSLILMLSIVWIPCNYLNIQNSFSLCRSRNRILKVIGVIFLDAVFSLLILITMVVLTSILPS